MDDSPAERCGGVFVCHYLLSIVSEYSTPFTVYLIAKRVGMTSCTVTSFPSLARFSRCCSLFSGRIAFYSSFHCTFQWSFLDLTSSRLQKFFAYSCNSIRPHYTSYIWCSNNTSPNDRRNYRSHYSSFVDGLITLHRTASTFRKH